MASESLGPAPAPPGWITFPLPLNSPGRCPPARPAGIPGLRDPPRVPVLGLLSCPLPPAPTQLGWKAYPAIAKGSPSPNSFFFISPIKVKFLEVIKPFCVILPEIQKPERKVSTRNRCQRRLHETGCLKFTVQLKMASTRQWKISLPSLPF